MEERIESLGTGAVLCTLSKEVGQGLNLIENQSHRGQAFHIFSDARDVSVDTFNAYHADRDIHIHPMANNTSEESE